MKVLLVEDDENMGELIKDALEENNFDVKLCRDGKEGLSAYIKGSYNIILLDVMMPNMDGFTLAERIKKLNPDVPFMFITAKAEAEDRIKGFEIGADDYLTKPLEIEELMCRISALTLRGQRKDINNVSYGALQLDKANSCLTANDTSLNLNNLQYNLMNSLMCRAPKTVNRQTLAEDIWGNEPPENDVLRTHIYQLRKLIASTIPQLTIDTEHGRGYRLSYTTEKS